MGQRKLKKLNRQKIIFPKMCLNMIVKNEAHIIKETLNNIFKYIDYWVISDTGSTDGTQNIIKDFFKEKNIPGELVEHEWKDFGYNRTKAFEAAYNKSEYVWVIDADDLVVGDLNFPKNPDKDMYLLKYGGTNLYYTRAQIFNNKLKWVYRGVLHEFAKCLDKNNVSSLKIDGNYYIDSRRLGDRNKDPKKYLKDAQILVKAIENNIDKDLIDRYTFYAGQSFRDYGDLEKCIQYYKKRIDLGGWSEELYISYMEIGNAMIKLNYDKKEIVESFMNGFKTLPSRSECLFFLSKYYFDQKDWENAYKTCKIASKICFPSNLFLFIKKDIHDYKCKELLLLIYICIQKNKILIKGLTAEIIEKEIKILFDFLTTDSCVPDDIKKKLLAVEKDLNKVMIEPEILEDYLFIENMDSYGGDIGHFDNKDIRELEEIASIYDNCIAFNTYGYLKHTINLPLILLPNKNYLNDGIYIKKDLAHKIIKNYGTELTSTPNVQIILTNEEKIADDKEQTNIDGINVNNSNN